MSDPAVEAAQRVMDKVAHRSGHVQRVAAAREALKPIRELHMPEPYAQGPDYCAECDHQWPCGTAKLIYTTEELEGGQA